MLTRSRPMGVQAWLEFGLEITLLRMLAIVSVLSLLALEVQAAEPGWRSHYAAQAGFRVEVPGEVIHDIDWHWSIAGKVAMHRYAIRHPGARLDLERHAIPRIALLVMSSGRLLDLARDGLMKDLAVDPEHEEEIVLQGYPGRKLLYRRSHLSGPEETRLYLAGSYVYLVSAGPWHPELRTTIVDRFFDSLRLCPTDPGECDTPGALPADEVKESVLKVSARQSRAHRKCVSSPEQP